MRIWSKKLITSGALPIKQLKAMRYELGDMIKQYPNIKHPLVKFANGYDIIYLGHYFYEVILTCLDRGINMNSGYNRNILDIVMNNTWCDDLKISFYYDLRLKFKEDNKEYLTICKWNLYEKYIRGMITKEEWEKIEECMN